MDRVWLVAAFAAAVGACAGRDPQPIATVQATDTYASCTQIYAEIQANNLRVQQLADEQGLKVAQNVAAGVAGLWPLWFAMDFKGAADKEVTARASNILPHSQQSDARREAKLESSHVAKNPFGFGTLL